MEVSTLADNLRSVKSQLELELDRLDCSSSITSRVISFTNFLDNYISAVSYQKNVRPITKLGIDKCKSEIRAILRHLDKPDERTLRKLITQIEFMYISLEDTLESDNSSEVPLDEVVYVHHHRADEKFEFETAPFAELDETDSLNHLLHLIDNNTEYLRLSVCPSHVDAGCIPPIFSLDLVPYVRPHKDLNLKLNFPTLLKPNPYQLHLM